MPFVPTNATIRTGDSWTNALMNTLASDLQTAFTSVPATDMADPLTMTQDVNGSNRALYGFRTYIGTVPDPTHGIVDATSHGMSESATGAVNANALQVAINSLPSYGGAICIPPGTYTIDPGIELDGSSGGVRSAVELFGFGDSTLLKLTAASAAIPLFNFGSGAQTTVRNLRIDGQNTLQTGVSRGAFETSGTSVACMIENVTVENYLGYAVKVEPSSSFFRIHRCRLEATDATIYLVAAIGQTAPGYTSIHGCQITGSQHGIFMFGGVSSTVIRACNITGCGAYGIFFQTSQMQSIDKVSIIGCHISGCQKGMYFYNTQNSAIPNTEHIRYVTVTGSTISSSTEQGIFFHSTAAAASNDLYTSQIRHCTFNGNIISRNAGIGIDTTKLLTENPPVADSIFAANILYANNDGIKIHGPSDIQGTFGQRMQRNSIFGNCSFDDRGSDATQGYDVILLKAQTAALYVTKHTVVANCVDGTDTFASDLTGIYDTGYQTDIGHNAGND